jgi:ABC-2 type transport system ATP-binding protein
MSLLNISEVRVSYANNASLKKLTVSIPEGVTVLIGPNGIGKSTLISVAEGLTRVDHREKVKLMGFSPYNESVNAFSEVSFLPERPVGIAGGTVRQWIKYYSLLRKISRERLRDLLSLFDIEYVIPRKWKELSSGELQLVSVILCLSAEAKFFVMDEPNANLDVINRMKLAGFIRKMNTEFSASFLITSHLLDEILPIADYAIIASKESLNGPITTNDGSGKDGFIVLTVADMEYMKEALEKEFDVIVNNGQLIIRNSNLRVFLSKLDPQLLEGILSIHKFPSYLGGVLNS